MAGLMCILSLLEDQVFPWPSGPGQDDQAADPRIGGRDARLRDQLPPRGREPVGRERLRHRAVEGLHGGGGVFSQGHAAEGHDEEQQYEYAPHGRR